MKPEGRALDIAVIGLGQAGGNLASEFFRRGYRALALNTAQTDLAALEPGGVYPAMPAERRIYIGLDGYDGAGADPHYGRECVVENAERIKAAVMKQGASADVIILAAGLGGGTGSAIAELVKTLQSEDLPLVALMTLPTEGESGIAKVNAVRAINEIVDAKLLGWIFIDNARITALNPDVSIVDYFAHINGQIASPIDALNRLNDRDNLKAIRSFDGEDFRKLLLSGGVLNYGVVELPSVTTEEVVGTVRDCIEASELMPAGFDMSRVSYLGLVIEANETALANTPISVFEEIHEQLKAETEGGAVYQGIYRCSDDVPPTMRLICASQSLPTRVRHILADAKREGLQLGEKIREEMPTLELGEIENFELFRTSPRNRPSDRPRRSSEKNRKETLLDDIASLDIVRDPMSEEATEDGVHRKDLLAGAEPRVTDPRVIKRRPIRKQDTVPTPLPPTPSRVPRDTQRDRSPDKRPSPPDPASKPRAPLPDDEDEEEVTGTEIPELGTAEIEAAAKLALAADAKQEVKSTDQEIPKPRRRPPPIPETGEVPKPEHYERMISDFKQAKHQRARDEVIRKLEEDSISEESAIRYYAVEAMVRLGRDVFGTALLAATEDENESVRALAVEALRRS